jgi:predicted acetyltransferase
MSDARFHYERFSGDAADMEALAQILSWSFGFPANDAEPWLRRGGLENVRVLRDKSDKKEIVACLLIIPMGQFFGGKSVRMAGVAGVATAATARGTGAATVLMRAAVEEMRASGYPISALYPATRTLYRRAGYEPAGGHFEVTVPIKTLKPVDRTAVIRPVEAKDEAAIVEAYTAYARDLPGHLDRGDYVWHRVKNPRGESARGFVIERGGRAGGLDGYVYLYEKKRPTFHYDLHITDIVARSPRAVKRLLTFLADHTTMGENLSWSTGPADRLVQALPEVGYSIELRDHWMIRVVDVPGALAARGYPEGLETEIHFAITDDLLPENTGKFVLEVAGGEGRVRKGGRGRLRLDIRGLAPLYSGHLAPISLEAAGLIEGPAAELARAAPVFAGPAPWMPDMF